VNFRPALPFAFLLFVSAVPAGRAHDVITTNLTWTREISRIIFHHCVGCHQPDGRAMSLATWQDARPWAKAIRDEVLARRMPPWDAVAGVGDFRNDPSLSQPEMDLLVAWVEGGAPEGDPIYLPRGGDFTAPPKVPEGRGIEARDSLTLRSPLKLTGLRPQGPAEVTASLPDGSVERLLWVRTFRPEWKTTYYFREPLSLPAGTKVLVHSASAVRLVTSAPPPAE
jgi:mono/diheme cytochrome c family protein